jgi:hypothetical protein
LVDFSLFLDFSCEAFLNPEPVYGRLLELSPKSSLGGLARGVHASQTANTPDAVRKAFYSTERFCVKKKKEKSDNRQAMSRQTLT